MWDGKEKRSMDSNELLIRIDENMTHVKEWCGEHKVDDDKKHDANLLKFDKIDRTIGAHQKVIYGVLGIVAFLEIVSKFIK